MLILGILILFIDKYIGWQELYQNLTGYSSGYALPLFLSLALLYNGFIQYHRSRTLVKYGRIVEVNISDTGIKQHHNVRKITRRSPWLHIQVKKRGPKQWIDANVRGVEYQWNVPNHPLYVVFHENVGKTLLLLGNEVIEASGLKRRPHKVQLNKFCYDHLMVCLKDSSKSFLIDPTAISLSQIKREWTRYRI